MPGTSVATPAAGQSIIAERYQSMAAQRKSFRLFNNLAVAFTIVFLSSLLNSKRSSTGSNKLGTNELLLGTSEVLTWFFFFLGLGYGRVQREQEWLLRVSMLLSAGALMAHVLNFNPDRLRDVGDLLAVADEPGHTYELLGMLAQIAAIGCRISVVSTCSGYLKDKKATRPARGSKKVN